MSDIIIHNQMVLCDECQKKETVIDIRSSKARVVSWDAKITKGASFLSVRTKSANQGIDGVESLQTQILQFVLFFWTNIARHSLP